VEEEMKKGTLMLILVAAIGLISAGSFILSRGETRANVAPPTIEPAVEPATESPEMLESPEMTANGFEVEVLVNGESLDEYAARGRRYVEALDGAEYSLRVHNPLGVRVAVALSVDGMNTIDARRSTAWDASKWVIEPYGTITIDGWQMSSSRARHFYFTTERDSYGAKIGQTANLGVISAVFYREREPIAVVTPPRTPRTYDDDRAGRSDNKSESQAPSSTQSSPSAGAQAKTAPAYPRPDDESAATGIGRNVRNDVTWVNLDLQSHPAGEVTIRYEYHDALVRLGIYPRPYPRPDALKRRERSTGFEDRRYSPEP
jgi:hypothetical protein